MTPISRWEVLSGVYAIKDNTCTDLCIIRSDDNFIAIDSGENQNRVEGELCKVNLGTLYK